MTILIFKGICLCYKYLRNVNIIITVGKYTLYITEPAVSCFHWGTGKH